MTALVRAEWTKLFTTRVWIGLLLGACLLTGVAAALFTVFAGGDSGEGPPLPPVGTTAYEQLALATGSNVSVLFLILGVIGMTQEYRHRTATPTFLTTPRRGRVVAAKLVAYGLAAVPLATVVLAVNVLVVALFAGARGDVPELAGDNLRVLAGVWAALVLFTLIGVGVGALVRNQVGAIVGALVYLFVIESILQLVTPISGAYKWLPGGALEAMTATLGLVDLLEPWQGSLVLLGYALVAALLGTVFAVRRDVV